jgi:DNA-binding HxlR family transcriptional regulator
MTMHGSAARSARPRQDGQVQTDAPVREPRRQARNLELDRLIHERVRLGIVSALAGSDSLAFNDLKKLLATTDGNLSVHARRLEEAGYIECRKSFDGRVPRTDYALTAAGRTALHRYLDHMETLIHRVRDGSTFIFGV